MTHRTKLTDLNDAPVLDAALAYAERGWPVYPVRYGRPLYQGKDPHFWGTTDPDTVREWFGGAAQDPVAHGHPATRVAIKTGRQSRLVVVQVENPDSWESLQAEYGPLPETARFRSHKTRYYVFQMETYKYPIMSMSEVLGPGTRVWGGCWGVAAPPGPRRRWLGDTEPAEPPAWLVKLCHYYIPDIRAYREKQAQRKRDAERRLQEALEDAPRRAREAAERRAREAAERRREEARRQRREELEREWVEQAKQRYRERVWKNIEERYAKRRAV
jgi:hypothetical protein